MNSTNDCDSLDRYLVLSLGCPKIHSHIRLIIESYLLRKVYILPPHINPTWIMIILKTDASPCPFPWEQLHSLNRVFFGAMHHLLNRMLKHYHRCFVSLVKHLSVILVNFTIAWNGEVRNCQTLSRQQTLSNYFQIVPYVVKIFCTNRSIFITI